MSSLHYVQSYSSSGVLQTETARTSTSFVGDTFQFNIAISPSGCLYVAGVCTNTALISTVMLLYQQDVMGTIFSTFPESLDYLSTSSQSLYSFSVSLFSEQYYDGDNVFMTIKDDSSVTMSSLGGLVCETNVQPSTSSDDDTDFQDLSIEVSPTETTSTTISTVAFGTGGSIAVVNSAAAVSSTTSGGSSTAMASSGSSGSTGMMTHFLNHCQFAVLMGCIGAQYPDSLNGYYEGYGWMMGMIKIDSLEETLDDLRETDSSGRRMLADEDEGSKSGIDRFANALGIRKENLFSNVFCVFMIIVICIASIYPLTCLSSRAYSKLSGKKIPDKVFDQVQAFVLGGTIRCFLAFFTVLCLLSTYQLTLEDHWLIELIAVFCLLACVMIGVFGAVIVSNLSMEGYSDPATKLQFGGYYSDYKFENKYFFLMLIGHKFFTAAFIASLEDRSGSQIAILMCIHCFYCYAVYKISPYCDSFQQKIAIGIALAQTVQMILTIGFVVGVSEGNGDSLAYALIVLHLGVILAYCLYFVRKAMLGIYKAFRSWISKSTECNTHENIANKDVTSGSQTPAGKETALDQEAAGHQIERGMRGDSSV